MLLFAALALIAGAMLSAAHAASFDAADGAKLFAAHCAVCHQASGEGIPGVFPPLKGSGVVLASDPTQQIRVLLAGIQGATVAGTVYSSPMPPFGITLSDREVVDIIDYERTSWGNHAPLATAREVAAVALACAGSNGVRCMQNRTVARTDRGSDPVLRESAGRGGGKARAQHSNPAPSARTKSGDQPGKPDSSSRRDGCHRYARPRAPIAQIELLALLLYADEREPRSPFGQELHTLHQTRTEGLSGAADRL
jgi:mono/diheme cytochrome c family protein